MSLLDTSDVQRLFLNQHSGLREKLGIWFIKMFIDENKFFQKLTHQRFTYLVVRLLQRTRIGRLPFGITKYSVGIRHISVLDSQTNFRLAKFGKLFSIQFLNRLSSFGWARHSRLGDRLGGLH